MWECCVYVVSLVPVVVLLARCMNSLLRWPVPPCTECMLTLRWPRTVKVSVRLRLWRMLSLSADVLTWCILMLLRVGIDLVGVMRLMMKALMLSAVTRLCIAARLMTWLRLTTVMPW